MIQSKLHEDGVFIPEFNIKKKKDQEYIKVGYPEDIKHLPIVFRITKSKHPSETLGTSRFHYGVVYLNNFYHVFKTMKGGDFPEYIIRMFQTYIHEFLHCYFFKRLTKEDMTGYKIKSTSWGWNERIVNELAIILTNLFFEDKDNLLKWLEMFWELKW